MEEMWNHPDVLREWSKSRQKRGKVRFSEDENKRPYLSLVEVKVRIYFMSVNYISQKQEVPKIFSVGTNICS